MGYDGQLFNPRNTWIINNRKKEHVVKKLYPFWRVEKSKRLLDAIF